MTENEFKTPPKPKIPCPIKQKAAVTISIILAPTLSINTPPIIGIITLGNAYSEYKRLNYAYPRFFPV